jgi:cyclopropane fatty-acyl-phospholipid synthase-like methyltransferase
MARQYPIIFEELKMNLEITLLNYILGLLLVACGWMLWRLYSKHHTLPCPSWLSWIVALDNPFAKAHKAQEIIKALPIKKDMRILDIGCGPGRVLLPLAQKISNMNGYVTGVDIQAQMLDKASAKAQKLHINNVAFIHGSIFQVSIKQKYDAILMVCVLGEIPQNVHLSFMNKVLANLQSGGIISITETIFDPHFQRYQKVMQLMEGIGFIQTKFIGNRFTYTAHFIKNKR